MRASKRSNTILAIAIASGDCGCGCGCGWLSICPHWLVGRFNEFSGSFIGNSAHPGRSPVEFVINPASIDSNHAKRYIELLLQVEGIRQDKRKERPTSPRQTNLLLRRGERGCRFLYCCTRSAHSRKNASL